jgi:hypothetical protein
MQRHRMFQGHMPGKTATGYFLKFSRHLSIDKLEPAEQKNRLFL